MKFEVDNEKRYTYYRNKRIPSWWTDYLPKERNPYKDQETLTLKKGCLFRYWHIYSSNKYPNYKGVEACNFVHSLIREKFGGAFLTVDYCGGRRQREIFYHEPDHIVYKNAYIGDDGNIHIKNAKFYYEDVIKFVMSVLIEIAKNHMQSGNSYNASEFFPFATDQQIEKSRKEAEIRQVNTIKMKEDLLKKMNNNCFMLDSFECSRASFSACYGWEDGWFNVNFAFEDMKTNLDSDYDDIRIIVDFPSMFHADSKKKDRKLATKELYFGYCFFLRRKATKDSNDIILPISADKVSNDVRDKINELCNVAMEDYNETHMDIIENTNCTPAWKYYPYNIFLDNRIGKLKLVYKEGAGINTLRYRVF